MIVRRKKRADDEPGRVESLVILPKHAVLERDREPDHRVDVPPLAPAGGPAQPVTGACCLCVTASMRASSSRHSFAYSQSRYSSKYGPPRVKCTSAASRHGL